MPNTLTIEVAYALETEQCLLTLQVNEGTSVEQAIQQSGLLEKFKDIDLNTQKVGIWSKLCEPNTLVKENDRVEIYRNITADPKIARRQRLKSE